MYKLNAKINLKTIHFKTENPFIMIVIINIIIIIIDINNILIY